MINKYLPYRWCPVWVYQYSVTVAIETVSVHEICKVTIGSASFGMILLCYEDMRAKLGARSIVF